MNRPHGPSPGSAHPGGPAEGEFSTTNRLLPDLPRAVGYWGALAVMVGIIIGSGIFRAPTTIAGELGQPWLILLFWLLGGLIALCGALTYAELATLYPRSGGVYVFLREGYGPCMAFVFGWTYLLISKPLAAAGIAVIFGEHVNQLLGTSADPRYVTSAVLIALTLVNIVGVRTGTGLALLLTGVKTLALLAIIVIGVALAGPSAPGWAALPAPKPLLAAIVPVMAAILWTYDGWSDVGAIAGEVRDPQRSLPRIFIGGTLLVIGLYLLVNAVYLMMIPLAEMRTTVSVAPLVMERLIGGWGGTAVTLLVLVSTLGSTHGSIISGARVTFAQAREGLTFRSLARIHPRFATPHVALLVQMVLGCLAVFIFPTFEALSGGFVFTMWIFYGLAGASIFILRVRRPTALRPYRCVGYPLVPVLFVLSAVGMTLLSLYETMGPVLEGTADQMEWRHWSPLIWLAILLMGVPVYFIWRRWFAHPPGAPR